MTNEAIDRLMDEAIAASLPLARALENAIAEEAFSALSDFATTLNAPIEEADQYITAQTAAAAVRTTLDRYANESVKADWSAIAQKSYDAALGHTLNEIGSLRPRRSEFSPDPARYAAFTESMNDWSERPVCLYMNGRMVGKAMDQDLTRAGSRLNRRIRMGIGEA